VGIGSGAYSSIFLAAPLVAALKEREPEFARRRDDLGALEGIATVGGTLATEAAEIVAGDGDGVVDDDVDGEASMPERVPAAGTQPPGSAPSSKRERRRQRRASRPHGRSR
jgi:preprotein translocase subunit SecF